MAKTKRVGKPQGVTDKDVIVAQKKAEKEAADQNNPLRQVYRDGQTVTMDASLFRTMINKVLYLQQDNMSPVYSPDGSGEMVGFSEKLNSEPIQYLIQNLIDIHQKEIDAGNTVDVDVLRQELIAKQNEVAPKMEVAK